MKNFKIFFLGALVVVASLFTACVEDTEIGAGPSVSEDCMEVYFVAGANSDYVYDAATDASQIVIPVTVARTYAAEAVSIPLTASQKGTMFNVPSMVEFASGQTETTFEVTLNSIEVGVHALDISLGDDTTLVNPYLSVGSPIYGLQIEFVRWVKVCDAQLKSALYSALRPTVLENKEGSSEYRLTSLWADGYDFHFTLGNDGKSYAVPESMWIGTMSGYPVIETGLTMGGYPLWAAFDGDPTYSYFINGTGMVISVYLLTNAAQYGWFDEVVTFSAE